MHSATQAFTAHKVENAHGGNPQRHMRPEDASTTAQKLQLHNPSYARPQRATIKGKVAQLDTCNLAYNGSGFARQPPLLQGGGESSGRYDMGQGADIRLVPAKGKEGGFKMGIDRSNSHTFGARIQGKKGGERCFGRDTTPKVIRLALDTLKDRRLASFGRLLSKHMSMALRPCQSESIPLASCQFRGQFGARG